MAKVAEERWSRKDDGHLKEHGLPKVRQAHRIVKRVKDRERNTSGGMFQFRARLANFTRSSNIKLCGTGTLAGAFS